MKKYIILLVACIFSSSLFAQNKHFTTSGTIEYEKRVNMYAIIKKMIDEDKENEGWYGPAFEAYKKNSPQFKTLKSTLTFTNNKTYYAPDADAAPTTGWFSDMPQAQQINTVYNDFNTASYTAGKKVFDELFVVKDSTRKINWKITDETREIAGYTCRRANALVMDSIYVVAFYTDEITVPGGPELFSGLPGMILGVALPHENMTWFATKVTDTPIAENTLKVPAKGKAVNNTTLTTILKGVMKNWGETGKKYFKIYLL